MSSILSMQEQRAVLKRIVDAQAKVQERLLRTVRLLASADIEYAVIGGNAVAAWVATQDESLVRTTRDVDVLVQRADLPRIRKILEANGYQFRLVAGVDMFLDGPDAKAGDGVHLIYASEKVDQDHLVPSPSIKDREAGSEFHIISLDALVRMKLDAWRRKDQVHLLDMIGVGLIDESAIARLPAKLAERLQVLLDEPNG